MRLPRRNVLVGVAQLRRIGWIADRRISAILARFRRAGAVPVFRPVAVVFDPIAFDRDFGRSIPAVVGWKDVVSGTYQPLDC